MVRIAHQERISGTSAAAGRDGEHCRASGRSRESPWRSSDSELIQYATGNKVRAERRCGELLESSFATPQGRGERGAAVRWNSTSDETAS